MTAAWLALLLAATPPRYGGELRVLAPASALSERDPASARAPLELALARIRCEPLYRLASAAGELEPDLVELPRFEGPRLVAMRLRPNDAAVAASKIAFGLEQLFAPTSVYRALALPLSGSLQVRGADEIAAAFAFTYPDWPLALSHVGTCAAPGSGPFAGKLGAAQARMLENPTCSAGRAFSATLSLRTATPRSAARSLAARDAEIALLAVPEPAVVSQGPLSVATYFAVNPRRPQLASIARAVAQRLDRAELVRIFVRGPAQPLYGLLAPSVEPDPVPPTPAQPAQPRAHLTATLLVDSSLETRGVAERIQVSLHDIGIDLRVLAVGRAELARRVANGDYDAALVAIPALPEPGLNLAQVLLLAEPEEQVKTELAAIGALPDRAARRERASARARELLGNIPVVPLYAQGLALSARAGVHGIEFDASGVPDLGAVWMEEPR